MLEHEPLKILEPLIFPIIGFLGSLLWWSLRTQITQANNRLGDLERDQLMQNDRLARLEIRSEGHTAGIQRLESKLDQTSSKIDQLTAVIHETTRVVSDRIDTAMINAMKALHEK